MGIHRTAEVLRRDMDTPKILVTTYHEAFLYKGGGEFELLEVALNLKKLGLIADVYGPNTCSLDSYDTVLHFSTHGSGLGLLQAARNSGKRIVLWPNFWPTAQIEERQLHDMRRFVELADMIVFKSHSESEAFQRYTLVDPAKLHFVPAGVEACYAQPAPKSLFRIAYNLDRYILWMGIIEQVKNQLRAIEALRELSLPVVFVGNYREREYYEACRKAAPKHFRFLPLLPHKSQILRSALQDCEV